jgi:hypothetical protein
MIESLFQLQGASSDIFSRWLDRDCSIRREKLRRLYGNSSADLDLAGHDRALRLLAAAE